MAPAPDGADCPDDSIDGLDLDLYADVDRLTEEFRDQLGRPGAVDADEFARRHPELVAVLVPALRAVETLQRDAGGAGSRGILRHGDRVGRFTIVGELGRGGMGIVYEAAEEGLERTVALKVLDGELATDAFRQRFVREARAAARLEHSAIVPVYGTGEDGTLLWYAMRRIEGAPLDVLLRRMGDESAPELRASAERALLSGLDRNGSDPSSSAASSSGPAAGSPRHVAIARLGQRLASALAYAHSEGVLHRDVKPGNVLVDASGGAHLADFGLCKLEGEASLTEASDVIGTLRYMPPEGLRTDVDARGDVYGLGLVLHELLTRQPAFDRRERARLIVDIERRDPIAPRRIDPTIPRDLERIVLKATAKLPEERYATADAFAQDLGAFLAGKPIQARPLGLWYLLRLTARRHRAATIVAAVSLVAILTLGVAYVVQLKGLLSDVTEARGQAEHGEAIALLNNVNNGLGARDRQTALLLLDRIVESERSWAWHSLRERVAPIEHEQWVPIRLPERIERFADGALLASDKTEVQIIDDHSLRRLSSVIAKGAGDRSEQFWGAVPAGDGHTVLIADGKSRSILRWSGDRAHVPETYLELNGIPSMLRSSAASGLAVVVEGRTVVRFRLDTGEVVDRYTPPAEHRLCAMEMTESGSVVYGTLSGELWRALVPGREPWRIGLHDTEVSAICVRGDDVVATGDVTGIVTFHPQNDRLHRRRGCGMGSFVRWIGGGDADSVFVAGADGTIAEVGLAARLVRQRWTAFSVPAIAVVERELADGTRTMSAFSGSGHVKELDDGFHGGPFAAASAVGPVLRMAHSPDGERIACVSQDGHLHVVGERAYRVPAENRYARPEFDAGGRHVAAGGLVLDAATGEEVLRWWPERGNVMASRWWGDELDLLVFEEELGGVGRTPPIEVWTWDRRTPADPPVLRGSFAGDVAWITNPQFAFPPDERAVVLTGSMGKLYRVDLESIEPTWSVLAHTNQIATIEYDRVRDQIISGSKDRTLGVTDARTGERVPRPDGELDAHARSAWSLRKLTLHPSGTLLASVDAAGAIRVWTYPEGREVLELEIHPDTAWVPRFAPDGRWLAFSTAAGTVELLGYGALPAWARDGAGRVTPDTMIDEALALMENEPLLAHHVVAAGSVLANLPALEFAELGVPGDDPRLVRLREQLDPWIVPTDLRMFRNRAFDSRDFEVGRFGFRDLDAFRDR